MTKNKEIFKVVPNHPMYEVSNMGRVRNRLTGLFLKQRMGTRGYFSCDLNKITYAIHRIVLETFIGERPYKMMCRHLDGNKTNNKLDNLHWGPATNKMKRNKETRRVIPKHPNYEASNTGKIYRIGSDKPRIGSPDKDGYLLITLDGFSRKAHHLILEAFVCPKPDGMQCRHLDGDPTNNNLENLKWGTSSENIQDFVRINNRYPNSKLLLTDVKKIKEKLQTGFYTQTAIAKMFDTHKTTVCKISRCRRFASV
jgi:hypothetical protein